MRQALDQVEAKGPEARQPPTSALRAESRLLPGVPVGLGRAERAGVFGGRVGFDGRGDGASFSK